MSEEEEEILLPVEKGEEGRDRAWYLAHPAQTGEWLRGYRDACLRIGPLPGNPGARALRAHLARLASGGYSYAAYLLAKYRGRISPEEAHRAARREGPIGPGPWPYGGTLEHTYGWYDGEQLVGLAQAAGGQRGLGEGDRDD